VVVVVVVVVAATPNYLRQASHPASFQTKLANMQPGVPCYG
jgi:hypothetical protein